MMRYIAFTVGFGVFALDLFTKWYVKKTIWLHDFSVIDGFFKIQYVRNEGIAFGLLDSFDSPLKPVFLSVIGVLALVFVVYYILKTPLEEKLILIAFGLLLGGILGNFTDRVIHHYVFDFLTLHWKDKLAWPTFNIADSAISTGVVLVLLKTLFESKKTAGMAAFILAILLFPFKVYGQQDPDIIESLQKKYNEIDSFSAEFEQTFTSRGIEMKEFGIVMMKRPGRMYWEYRQPAEKYFVADGKKTFFFVPKDNQVLVTEMALSDSGSPLLFLLGKGDIRRDFDSVVENSAEKSEAELDTVTLKLTPKVPNPEFIYLILEIEKDSFLIRKLTVVEPIGQQNEYALKNMKENVRIPNKQFELKIPSNVEVIEQ